MRRDGGSDLGPEVEVLREGVIRFNPEGEILTKNIAAIEMLGYVRGELLGVDVRLILPSLRESFDPDAGQRPHARKTTANHKDGHALPIELTIAPTMYQGEPAYLAVLVDRSDRESADEALRRERGLLKAVVDNAVDGIATIDEHGMIITVNHAVLRMFGYEMGDLIGKNIKMLMPSPYYDEHDEYLKNYLETGVKKIIGIGREVRGCRKDGTLFPLELAVSETNTESGRIFTGILRDVSERWETEGALNRERRLFKAVFETAVDGIITTDERGIITNANPAVERMFGYKASDLVGRSVNVLMPVPHYDEHDKFMQKYLRTGEKHIIGIGREVRARRQDGSLFPLHLAVSETRTEDGFIFTGIMRDISDWKRAQQEINDLNTNLETRIVERTAELQDLVNELEGFTHSVAHDLRSPLRSINANAHMLMTDYASAVGEDGVRRLRSLAEACVKMGQIMDDLLGYASLGRRDIEPKRVDLGAIAKGISESLDGAEIIISPHLEAEGDPNLLYLALQNLIGNAYKYAKPDTRPRIEVGQIDGTFFVRDNGIGFDEKYAEKMFEPFQRLVQSTQYPGTGIGLANVRRIINKHGGEVWAESKPGEGATFFFTLGAHAA